MATAKDNLTRVVTGVHRFWFTATNGLIGRRVAGMPVLMLTTTGRKSGKKRDTMLTSPLIEDDRVVLVASYGGDPRHPKWFLNLRETPDVEITMKGRRRPMRARVATQHEKDELWPRVTRKYRGYAQYQNWTDRDIPLVILEPAS